MKIFSNNKLGIEAIRQEACLAMNIILMLVCLIYCLIFISKGHIQNSIPFLVTILGVLFSLYLSFKQKFLASSILTLLLANVLIFYTVVIYGYETQSHIFLIVLVAATFLLFENIYLSLLNLLLVIIVHIICYTYFLKYGSFYQIERLHFREYSNFIVALISAAYLSFRWLEYQKGHEAKNNDFLDQIRKKNLHLTNKNEQLKNIIYISSHDLQEPLKNIQNMASLIIKDTKSHNEETKEAIEILNHSTQKMSKIITGIMKYAQIGNQQKLELVDTNRLINEVTANLSKQVNETGASFKISELPTIWAYRSELSLLFQSLLSNAIKFRHADRKPIITIWSETGLTHDTFWVKDNGIGIDEKYGENIFAILKKMHNQEVYEGIGLGLAYCKKITELHEGDIKVSLNANYGSTFYFTIKKLK